MINQQEDNYSKDFCRLFEEQVLANPEKIALICGEKNISYENLNKNANKLARRLVKLGVTSDYIVSVFANRTIELVTAIIAIWKSGGAYLPLNPEHPIQRQHQIFEQSGSELILVSREFYSVVEETVNKLPVHKQPKFIVIEDEIEKEQSAENLQTLISQRDLAYVIFTSGSTGVPKGAMVERRGMVNHLYEKIKDLNITSDDHVVESASQCFDISIWQFFAGLIVGGQVHIFSDHIAHDPILLMKQAELERVSIIQVVPSMLRAIVNTIESIGEPFKISTIRWVCLVGEALPPIVCRKWFKYYKDIPLLNSYGPTECSDGVTHYKIFEAPDEDVINMPIGVPINNLVLYVLKTETNELIECSKGEPGELCVSGIGVGRGYVNNEEKTKSAFLENPFSKDPDFSAIYKTGDLVNYLDDGNLVYLGRIDRQVKIRGFRIELGEIEAALSKYESVKACAVIARNTRGNKHKLVARECLAENQGALDESIHLVSYIVSNRKVLDSELRKYLQEHLPSYMVPERFVRMDALPLNSNGKLDVKALPEPDSLRPDLDVPYVAPINEIERRLCEIWIQILCIDRVGTQDGFFDLGGDSLLAMQIINKIRVGMAYEISFDKIFTKTISEIAVMLDKQEQNDKLPDCFNKKLSLDATYPLSLEQQRLWFLWKLNKNSPFYTLQGSISLNGDIDVNILKEAWEKIVQNHDTLRVRFGENEGRPFQRFEKTGEVDLRFQDLTNLLKEEQQSIIKRAAGKEINHVFDLEKDSLFRLNLFKLSEEEHTMILTTHEIIIDAWALSIIMRELEANYHRILQNPNKIENDTKVQFRNYILWESENITKEKLKSQEEYWREKLSGTLPVLNLPTKTIRSNTPNHKGRSKGILLSKDLSNKLRILSREKNSTLFMTILAAFNVLLYNYTGQDDIIVGSPHVNRSHPGTEDLIGFFLNMIPLRTSLANDPSFENLLEGVRQTVIGGIANSEYPFLWTLEFADVVRSSSISPVFQVMFNMYSERAEDDNAKRNEININFKNLNISFREMESGYTKYDLTLYAQENGDQIYLQMSYFIELFEDDFIERMVKNFEVLLNSIVEEPSLPISQLKVLTDSEINMQLFHFNNKRKEYDLSMNIHEMFEMQVEKTPEKTAFICNDETISYLELNQRSNQLAHYLRGFGVSKGSLVAICVERSFEMIIGILAIMKAGGTYIALDPTYPRLRLNDILDDTNASILIVQNKTDFFNRYENIKINLDTDFTLINIEENKNLAAVTGQEDILNIVYTSSSTGKPKGVLINNKSVLNRLNWMWDTYPFSKEDVAVLQKSYALVAATWEIFGGLLKGIPTLILSREDVINPSEFWNKVTANKVSFLLASPPIVQGVINQKNQHQNDWTSLRLATTSAEPIPPSMVKDWYKAFPNVPLLNLYGSTECSSNASVYDTRDMSYDSSIVPIGKPLTNVQTYILNKNLKPVPIGVVGEMCISGDCVSNGYLNLQDLTSERFIKNPFSNITGSILYRSGDLARYCDDGTIELVGRADFQVKLRGFRIELGEIEAALKKFPNIKKAIVTLREDVPGDKRLVAYIVADKEYNPKLNELRTFLQQILPEYMVPAFFVILENLPTNSSGKIDRAALPVPDEVALSSAQEYVAARDELERSLVVLWEEVLGTSRIGIYENFFELGGHSLKAVNLISKIHNDLKVEIPLTRFFNNPTIKDVADYVRSSEKHELAPIEPAPVKKYYELSTPQKILFPLNQLQGISTAFNMPLIMMIEGKLDILRFEQAFQQLVNRYEILRTSFQYVDGQPVQVINDKVNFNIDYSEDNESNTYDIINGFIKEFDISKAPLLRVGLVKFSDKKYLWLFDVHLLIMDNKSKEVLVGEFTELYNGNKIPEIKLQYKDFSVWQNALFQSDALGKQKEYWSEVFKDGVPVLNMPTDFERPDIPSYENNILSFDIPDKVRIRLNNFVLENNTTLNIVMFSIYATLLGKYSNQDDILLVSAVEGRNHPDLEEVVGEFSYGLPIKCKIDRDKSFIEAINSIKDTMLSVYENQQYPFDKLELDKNFSERYSRASMLSFVNGFDAKFRNIHIKDLQLTPVEFDNNIKDRDFRMTIFAYKPEENISCLLRYNKQLFKHETMVGFAENFINLIERLIKSPYDKLIDMELFSVEDDAEIINI
ncbi:MAG: amino acid adenylation domain-containing protein [Bacillota bacterium]|nr:amino acid adenylation domain-containing protein [Bacillota bacterium]